MKISAVNLAWIAGLLEGEGCFTRKNRDSGIGTARNITISCHMTDLDVLKSIKLRIGAGGIGGPYTNGPKPNKPRWMYRLNGPKARLLMGLLLPFMHKRRSKRMRQLMAGFDSVPIRTFEILHIRSGKKEITQNLKAWEKAHGMSDSALWRTLNGKRASCYGWKRLS